MAAKTTIQLKRLTSTTLDLCEVVLAAGEPLLGKMPAPDTKDYIVFGDGTNKVKDLTREPIGDTDGSVLTDGQTIDGDGLTGTELEVMISADADNVLEKKTDGLYVNQNHDVDGGEI